jgi:hypothetical protein
MRSEVKMFSASRLSPQEAKILSDMKDEISKLDELIADLYILGYSESADLLQNLYEQLQTCLYRKDITFQNILSDTTVYILIFWIELFRTSAQPIDSLLNEILNEDQNLNKIYKILNRFLQPGMDLQEEAINSVTKKPGSATPIIVDYFKPSA